MAVAILDAFHYGLPIVEIDDVHYAIGFKEEVMDAFCKYIKENLWTIDEHIVARYSLLCLSAIEILTTNLGKKCNDCLVKSIINFDNLIYELSKDGIGFYLATFNHQELTLRQFISKYPNELNQEDISYIMDYVDEDIDNIYLYHIIRIDLESEEF